MYFCTSSSFLFVLFGTSCILPVCFVLAFRHPFLLFIYIYLISKSSIVLQKGAKKAA